MDYSAGPLTKGKARKGSQGKGCENEIALGEKGVQKRGSGRMETKTPAARLHSMKTSSFTYRTFTWQRAGSRWGK